MATAAVRSVELSWAPNPEPDLTHYNVYAALQGSPLAKVAQVPAGTESYLLQNLEGFVALDFALSAGSGSGESATTPPVSATPVQTGFYAPGYLTLHGNIDNYLEVSPATALNPTNALTIEGWLRFHGPAYCTSLIGNGFHNGYWVGICSGDLRSYTRGSDSDITGGTIPIDTWVHFAVTSDGVTRRHYLDGVLVSSVADAGAPTTSTDPVRIGLDSDFFWQPEADLRELRIWSIARSLPRIRESMNSSLSAPEDGLLAVWPLAWDGRDALGNHSALPVGSPAFGVDGTIDSDSTFMLPPDIGGGECTGEVVAFAMRYDILPFYAESDGLYTLTVHNVEDQIAFYVMEGSFDPNDPVITCVAAQTSNDEGVVTVNLPAGRHYAVAVHESLDQSPTRDFTISLAGPL